MKCYSKQLQIPVYMAEQAECPDNSLEALTLAGSAHWPWAGTGEPRLPWHEPPAVAQSCQQTPGAWPCVCPTDL